MEAEKLCKLVEIVSSAGCFESWLFRYQTLLVGVLAVGVAFLQARIFSRQTSLTEMQMAIMAKQEEMQASVDRIRVKRACETMTRLHDYMGSFLGHNEHLTAETFFIWYPNKTNWDYISDLPWDSDVDQLINAAMRIAPGWAPAFAHTAHFFKQIRWLSLANNPPEDLTPDQNQFFDKFFSGRAGCVFPDV